MRTNRLEWILLPAAVAALLCSGAVPQACGETLAVKWNDVLLQCVRLSKIGPPMVARAIGVTHTCGYDAWAMYDQVAMPTRPSQLQRVPVSQRSEANKEKAYSFAEYRALLDLFPGQRDTIRARMAALGYDPDDATMDPSTPSGLGTICAIAVTTFRHADGSNQLGDRHPGPYTDYTGYVPVNTAQTIVDPNHWQPLEFCDGHGGFVSPSYVAPQWGEVTPFALSSWDQFHLGPPQNYPHGEYLAQAEKVLQLNAHIDDTQKMIAEYWADGPHSELPPGHFTLFAEFVSNRDHHTFDQDVKMFFILGNAEMDAGIAVWGTKRHFDSERPITAIHFLKAGKKVLAYVPFKGPQVINGEDWMPYQPCNFVTPPFPEYPSGHSAFSAAGAEILKRFSGSDAFGGSVTFAAGSGRVEPGFAPAHDVTLAWATFSDAADQAGMSRRYGGIHFEQGDLDSRLLGREVAAAVWDKALTYINGTAGTLPLAAAASPAHAQPPGKALPGTAASENGAAAAEGGLADGVGAEFAIASVVPNPMSQATRVDFVAPRAGRVRLSVFDVQGREIAVLAEGMVEPGRHQALWSRAGGTVPAGIYFVRYQTPAGSSVRRVAALR